MTKHAAARATDIALAPAIALVSYVLLHWQGIGMFQDGWAAWQGAASLAAGRGYTYFSGNPIAAWPPLYSAYMALWMAFLGPTGWGLLLANGFLVVLQAFAWNRLIQAMASDTGLAISIGPSVVLSLFIGLLIAVQQRSILSHNLVYVFLPLYLGIIWRYVFVRGMSIKPTDLLSMIVLALRW